MQFYVTRRLTPIQQIVTPTAVLIIDDWDDWFQFSTMYTLWFLAPGKTAELIGSVKIGQFGMKSDQRRPEIPEQFEALGDRFFSLGQDDRYYWNLNQLGASLRDEILAALRDIPFSEPTLFESALKEKVTTVSLLRSVTKFTVNEQFRRIARGGARLTKYSFEYQAPRIGRSTAHPVKLSFEVEPRSNPPSNIHVIIGRNGVGKTHLLNAMTRTLVSKEDESEAFGEFNQLSNVAEDTEGSSFANLVSVTFSAFDPFEPVSAVQNRKNEIKFSYIGLKRVPKSGENGPLPPKTPQMLSAEFSNSAKICRQEARAGRWSRALRMLESDPIFRDAQVAALAPSEDEENIEELGPVSRVFSRLSSGHKIVLLTITRLVETVAERTLVLIDEPEAHLHPPLLSAFIRALSDLLVDRNGVAIIATHSPVILQEVPRKCVWKVRRSGTLMIAERPEIETFGESVGVLTREVFGLEVSESGFHRLLAETIPESQTYEQALQTFNGELGGEAKAILRGLLADRDEEEG